MRKLMVLAVILISTSFLQSQTSETEPNNDKLFANPVSVGQTIEASFHTTTDQDYFKIELELDKMYYLTSVENSSGLKPDLNLYNQASSTNLLQSSVAGRNGNNNFRLSGYVPYNSGVYYARVFEADNETGQYKFRFAGGRGTDSLLIHEPDNTKIESGSVQSLALGDTLYGAIYPANDFDYYKIEGTAGNFFEIGTMPILDLHPRDTDTYITLYNASGQIVMENDDLGNVDTPSGTVNCTFSSLKGLFSVTGVYYVCVRSYYNSIANEDLVLNENHPPTGEYGLYYNIEKPEGLDGFARYPHVECPTTSSIIVQWNTLTQQPSVLYWGTTKECTNVIEDLTTKSEHKAKITNLEPHTKYFYKVWNGDSLSKVEHFYSAKPSSEENVSFFVISDSSPYEGFGSSEAQRDIAALLLETDCDFGLHSGDVNQHRGEEYDLVYYQPYKDILKNKTIFPCIGNHDNAYDHSQTYLASFNLPYNNPDSTERYYSFNYGNGHFISLDTDWPYSPGSAQYEWLVQDLQSEMRSETMWTVIIFHKPPWSEGWPGYPGETSVQTYLVPLFEQYGVDMVFNGHTHDYERGYLNGVYYIIAGGGGAPLEEGIHAYDYEHVTVWINQHHYVRVDLNDKTMTLSAINRQGEIIDYLQSDKNTTDVNDDIYQDLIPKDFKLYQNYPNPFNGSTVIEFDVPEKSFTKVTVYDISGHLVKTLMQQDLSAGKHSVKWDGLDQQGEQVASGIYFIRLQTSIWQQTLQALYLK